MTNYEAMFVIHPSLDEEAAKGVVEKFKELIEANGTLEKMDEWGKKRLAYEVQDEKEGYYVLANFAAGPEFPAELERIFKITESVMKYMVINLDNK